VYRKGPLGAVTQVSDSASRVLGYSPATVVEVLSALAAT
jgi:hypothetical protein